MSEAGVAGSALAALLIAIAHVRRRHGRSGGVPLDVGIIHDRMIALNILRELDVLLAHAIDEAAGAAGLSPAGHRSSTRSRLRMLRSVYAVDSAEDAGLATFAALRHALMQDRRAASADGRWSGMQGGPAGGDFGERLSQLTALNDRIARKLTMLTLPRGDEPAVAPEP